MGRLWNKWLVPALFAVILFLCIRVANDIPKHEYYWESNEWNFMFKRALGKLLNRIVKDDLIICTELSRLGRNLFMIMEILNICMTKESRVWTIKDNYRLGDDIQSKVLAFAFGLSAEIERNLISQRTKEALARLKKEGHPVGRGQGQRNKQLNAKCVAKHKYIESQMEKGISVPQIAKKLRIARGTLYRYLAYTGLRTPTKSRNGRWERGIY